MDQKYLTCVLLEVTTAGVNHSESKKKPTAIYWEVQKIFLYLNVRNFISLTEHITTRVSPAKLMFKRVTITNVDKTSS